MIDSNAKLRSIQMPFCMLPEQYSPWWLYQRWYAGTLRVVPVRLSCTSTVVVTTGIPAFLRLRTSAAIRWLPNQNRPSSAVTSKPASSAYFSRSRGAFTFRATCWYGDDVFSFRTMACSALIESGLWSRDAVERQMSHQERNGVRAAYIHKAEHLEERRLMLQWWADFLNANRERFISPFEYAKINNPLKQ